MKQKLNILYKAAIAVIALCMFSSCSNGLFDADSKDTVNDGKAYISFGFADSSRTIGPDFAVSSLTDITITATSTASGAAEQTLVSGKTYTELSSCSIMIEEGTYNFTATAQLGQYTYKGTIESKTISSGTNSLSFALKKSGSVSGVTGKGTYSITLSVTDSTVKKVKATLMDFDRETTLVAEASLTAGTDGTYEYKGNIDAGDYTVIFNFYGDTDGLVPVGTYSEVVNVAPGITSSANRSIVSVNEVQAITVGSGNIAVTYSLKDGQTLPSGYTRLSGTITLPDLVSSDYNFAGWYKDNTFTTKITEISYSTCGTDGSATNTLYNKAAEATKIIFGYTSDYAAAVASLTAVSCDDDKEGNIKAYYDDETDSSNPVLYVLSEGTIAFGKDDTVVYQDMTCGPFADCENATEIIFDNIDTSELETMLGMFLFCESLTSLDLSNIDTSSAAAMDYMFCSCSSLTSLDLSKFDTSKVTSMASMFEGCDGLTSINVSSFNTANVTTMEKMFRECDGLTSINVSSFNTANVTTMEGMFYKCSSLTGLNISNFNTSSVTTMKDMFHTCSSLTSLDLSNFNTSNVTVMCRMFYECTGLTGVNVSSFDTSNVTDFGSLFYSCSALTSVDLSSFNTSSATSLSSMFDGCSLLTVLDLTSFSFTNVNSVPHMFDGCTKLTTIYVASDTDLSGLSTSGSTSMFLNCTSLVGANGTTYNSSYTDGSYARVDAEGTPGYFSVKTVE